MTVRLMSDGELTRLEVLRDLDKRRLTVETTAQLLGLERRQVFRLLKARRGAPPSEIGNLVRLLAAERGGMTTEQPNTLAGLVEKRAEIAGQDLAHPRDAAATDSRPGPR